MAYHFCGLRRLRLARFVGSKPRLSNSVRLIRATHKFLRRIFLRPFWLGSRQVGYNERQFPWRLTSRSTRTQPLRSDSINHRAAQVAPVSSIVRRICGHWFLVPNCNPAVCNCDARVHGSNRQASNPAISHRQRMEKCRHQILPIYIS